jgi:hypothetical protein
MRCGMWEKPHGSERVRWETWFIYAVQIASAVSHIPPRPSAIRSQAHLIHLKTSRNVTRFPCINRPVRYTVAAK